MLSLVLLHVNQRISCNILIVLLLELLYLGQVIEASGLTLIGELVAAGPDILSLGFTAT